MRNAVFLEQPGGREKLQLQEIALPAPGAGELLLRHTAIGVNFIDIYHRTGLYPLPHYPIILGLEAAGVVEACGEGAKLFRPGERVAYARGPIGGYATHRAIAEKALVKLPDTITDEEAAAVMLKGLTAQYLLRRAYRVEKGHTILIHAAAGGVGLLVCQLASHLGARVIGTVGSAEKAALAKANGCHEVILYREENIAERVRALTGGKGVDVVYDSVGKDTFMASLDCLRKMGMLVSFGQASGTIPPFDMALLQQKGSLFLTRPTLMHYIEERSAYEAAAEELFALPGAGVLTPRIDRVLPLAEAAEAHRLLESRETSGAVILRP